MTEQKNSETSALAWPNFAPSGASAAYPGLKFTVQAAEYWTDAWQRSILFWDTMRKRGNLALEHSQKGKPPVLDFDYEMIMDGRDLERPANYALLRITPDADTEIDPKKRPFVVIDPRAGHGPGIGGFKADSQIGVALRAGHPCYFVTFFPEPVPGQRIEDIARAEANFLREVMARHPEAEGKPCVIGNCQAGWAVAMLGAVEPDVVGPIMLNGAPLSYWAGSGELNPMRYVGGLLGGSWMATLASDLGGGLFDGAHLVSNFQNLNPANTLWSKQYNLYSNIDTEEERFLDFERWWGGFYLMNAEEMEGIVDNLFVGNRLRSGELVTSKNEVVDLRNIRSPIIVFASWGDNITPPQQALNWILDLYNDVDEIRANEQVIVYTLHDDIGHLGIFVSGQIARKEHATGIENLDIVDTLPPGLYEAIIDEKRPDDPNAELIEGDYIVRYESRTLDDIRALGGCQPEDERAFETVSRVADANESLYRSFVQPWLKAFVNEQTAEMSRDLHPLRLERRLASDSNPFMQPVKLMAESVRRHRRPVSTDNPFLAWEKQMSDGIVSALDSYREWRDRGYEAIFKAVYGSTWLQAMVGLRPDEAVCQPQSARDPGFMALIEKRFDAISARADHGGFNEGVMRIFVHVVAAKKMLDARSFRMARELRIGRPALTPVQAREMLKEQALLLWLDEDLALSTLGKLLPTMDERRDAVDAVRRIAAAAEPLNEEQEARLRKVEAKLGIDAPVATGRAHDEASAKAPGPQPAPGKRKASAGTESRATVN